MSEGKSLHLIGNMNAQAWAVEFMKLWGHRMSEIDESLMIGWFANSIMAGYDKGRGRDDASRENEPRMVFHAWIKPEQAAHDLRIAEAVRDWFIDLDDDDPYPDTDKLREIIHKALEQV